MSSQNADVLEWMRTHDGITTLEAFINLGVTRLSARIWELRAAGYAITASKRTVGDRHGNKVSVCLYRLAA